MATGRNSPASLGNGPRAPPEDCEAPLKVYSSDTDENRNGTAPEPEEDLTEEEEFHDFSALFDAPSYSEFIKTAPNSRARSYEKRVQSMMKAGMVGSLHAENWADAATFLKHGPGFAKAAGNLAAEDARAARLIEMVTAPDSPYTMFVMATIPFIAQLFRNHASEFEQVAATRRERRAQRKQAKREGVKMTPPTPPITIHLFRREIKIPIRFRMRLPNLKNVFKSFLAPTQHPAQIAAEVFNDPAVVKALHKMGLFPRKPADDGE